MEGEGGGLRNWYGRGLVLLLQWGRTHVCAGRVGSASRVCRVFSSLSVWFTTYNSVGERDKLHRLTRSLARSCLQMQTPRHQNIRTVCIHPQLQNPHSHPLYSTHHHQLLYAGCLSTNTPTCPPSTKPVLLRRLLLHPQRCVDWTAVMSYFFSGIQRDETTFDFFPFPSVKKTKRPLINDRWN